MKIFKYFLTLFPLFLIIGFSSLKEITSTKQLHKEFQKSVTINYKLNYLLYLPKEYDNSKSSFPLVLFLHGKGERGDSLDLVKRHGPPMLVEKGKDFPFILVSPQCPDGLRWTMQIDELIELLNKIINDYKVDTNRIYLTGLSRGGFGTWALAAAYPERFAAIAPICGGGNPVDACKIKNVPVWAFHGAKDNVVPLQKSQEMIDGLKKCGAEPKFTIYPDAGHNSWTETYNNPELYKWLLSQKKESK